MGNLKPIGSEKLQGMDKIKRIMEIARYKENTPNPINESMSTEYTKVLPDGFKYEIVKEKNGYVIKKQISEGVSEYIEPMKNRKYYSAYSQALKRLNLILKEVNNLTGQNKNISLFYESEMEEKDKTKYYLKLDGETNEQTPAPAPAPAPAPETQSSPMPEPAPVEEPPMEEPQMDSDETPEPEIDSEEKPEEKVTFKTIQKLTGKLGQKLRTLSSDEEQEMSSKDIKYVVNSILSALELDKLEDEDKEEIMSKFEGEDMSDEEDMGDIGDEDGEEVSIETPEPPTEEPEPQEMGEESSEDMMDKIDYIFGGEMDEETDDDLYDFLKMSGPGTKEIDPEEETITRPTRPDTKPDVNPDFDPFTNPDPSDDPEARMRRRRFGRKPFNRFEDDMEMDFDSLSESKIDSVLKKYFKIDENEKKMLEEKKSNRKDLIKKVKQLSENIAQEVVVTKMLTENKNTKLVGKTNLKNIVIKVNNKEVKISPNGDVL